MRASLNLDPVAGAGYGILEISGISNAHDPRIIIRRMSDGKTMAQGGWRSGTHSIAPEKWDSGDNALTIWLNPQILDNLDGSSNYQIILPGLATLPLEITEIRQSVIVEGETPPPVAPPEPATADVYVEEGVEPTPEMIPGDGEGKDLDGVVAAPDNAIIEKRPRRHGCLFLAIGLGIVWVLIGWFLWHAAMNAPKNENHDTSAPFSFIPYSDEEHADTPREPLAPEADDGKTNSSPGAFQERTTNPGSSENIDKI